MIFVAGLISTAVASATPIPTASHWIVNSEATSGAGLIFRSPPIFSGTTATFSQNSTNFLYYPAAAPGTANAIESVGFDSTTFVGGSSGTALVNSTWFINATEFAGLHCYNAPGRGNFTVNVLLEENVYDISSHSWLLPANQSIPILPANDTGYSGSCPPSPGWLWLHSGPVQGQVLAGAYTVSSGFTLTKGSIYFVSTAVHVTTVADEYGASDMWVYACINFDGSAGCHTGSVPGNAKLATISVA